MGLYELTHPEASSVAPSCLSRKCVVGPNDLVTVSNIGFNTAEQSSVISHVLLEEVPVAMHDLNVLGGDALGFLKQLLVIVTDDDFSIVLPRF